MPRISEFYGIIIAMFYNDHDPAHFHVIYGEHMALVGIDHIRMMEGKLPRRALGMVMEWAAAHQSELRHDWQRARERRPLIPIEPLD
ncbi:MAG: DUF4160 domain-containing protein [Chloroflexi bacterium]|nr:DUF4160 domain-containing protein [Chloroflexota bacterium]